jgi:23S rRNA (cytosine1962-C5)-methyltransferase
MDNVTLTPRGLERLKTGHVWVYRSDVKLAPETPGFYSVLDANGRSLGWAAVNTKSEITVRMVTRFDTVADEKLLVSRLERAMAYREILEIDADCYRLVHGEADGLPGLVIDRYGDYLVWQSNTAALEPYLDTLLEAAVEKLQPRGVLARFDSRSRELEGLTREVFVAHGEVPEMLHVREGRVKYLVEPWTGQKTGAFLDQRENRIALARRARGRALDVFSYHGSFGLHLATTCETVECMDSSAPALERARENAALNKLENLTYTVGNAFDLLREREREGKLYDAISLDPPAFAKAKRDLDAAYRAYKEVNLRAMRLLDKGGILGTASCSYHVSEAYFYEMLRDAAADAGRTVRVLERRSQSSDHPEIITIPETRYLKYALLEIVE